MNLIQALKKQFNPESFPFSYLGDFQPEGIYPFNLEGILPPVWFKVKSGHFMTRIPHTIKAFEVEGIQYIQKKAINNLFFSFGSYQSEIYDPAYNEPIYSFIQMSKGGELKDFFCTCRDSEAGLGCPHVSALYFLIMDDTGLPLHERYNVSVYKALARLFYEKRATIKQGEKADLFFIVDEKDSNLAKVKIKSQEGFHFFKEEFLEEEGAGFQELWGLSLEEGEAWKKPENREELLFEQSFWNEWGKKLIFLKALEKSKEKLKKDKQGLPIAITIDFQEIRIDVEFSLKDLRELIPTFGFMGTPVLQEGKGISFIEARYHEKSAILELIRSPYIAKEKESPRLYLPGWVFLKNQGFIQEDVFFPSSKIVMKEKIPDFLKREGKGVLSLIENREFLTLPLHYSLSFDLKWNLIINAYLFTEGDLQKEKSWLHKDYAYIEGKGFYQVEESLFPTSTFIVESHNVPFFIHTKRNWLSQIPGFEIHSIAIESEMSYQVNKERSLTFLRNPLLQGEKTKEFGPWVYGEGIGFFPKESTGTPFFIKPNTLVTKEHIPLFIKERREELKLIKGFFLQECPIENVQLDLKLLKGDELLVSPLYHIKPFYQGKEILFFEDILYVKGEGFFELPPHLRLPEEYRSERILTQDILENFFHEIEKLARFIPILDVPLKKPSSLKLFISKAEEAEKGSYKIKVFWGSEYGKIDFLTVWDGKRAKKRFLFTEAGLIDLQEDRFRWLSFIKKTTLDRKSGMFSLSVLEFYRLDALEEIEYTFTEKDLGSERVIQQLRQLTVSEKMDVSLLKSTLRPYQQTGAEWLWFLYVHGLSGLLSDDMGLGKTHQAMALISSLIMAKGNERAKVKVLVVSPASVIHHWEDKLKDFMPSIRASIYHGTLRSYEETLHVSDIVITTYGILRRDIHQFIKTTYSLAIFDEIQIAKNKESRIHKELKKIKSFMKVGLSGTPIENNLYELKALFDIILPNYMPSESEFRERFIKPILKAQDEEVKASLKRLIKPFVLRRKKNDVLFELPEKMEEISHCDLSKEQAEFYNGLLSRSREPLIKALSEDSREIPYFHIFALLTQLKKICDHPALFLGKSKEFEQHQSGKWNLFQELISEAFESGQKVVVFTQYLGMLDIMVHYFEKERVDFALIKGSTKNRKEEIRRFNEEKKCRVFLGSLLAGGLGIDLIGGSVVIHYDRWWNAARENQATDRVHRIGQSRGVQVFKLVTKNTFEERIDEIIREKGKLAEDIVPSDEAVIKLFTRNELKTLLEYSKWEEME